MTDPPSLHAVQPGAEAASIHVHWQPSTEVFDFSIDQATRASTLKHWLSNHVACNAPHMHLVFGATQLHDHAPLSQHVGHGDTLRAHPKRGG